MHVGRERTTRGWVSHAVSTCNSRHYVRNSASTPLVPGNPRYAGRLVCLSLTLFLTTPLPGPFCAFPRLFSLSQQHYRIVLVQFRFSLYRTTPPFLNDSLFYNLLVPSRASAWCAPPSQMALAARR